MARDKGVYKIRAYTLFQSSHSLNTSVPDYFIWSALRLLIAVCILSFSEVISHFFAESL